MGTNLAHFTTDERDLIMAAIYAGSGSDHTPVANEAALALLADMTDKMVCLVEATGLYRYDSTSTETAAVGNVVTPASGVGRWIRISGISDLRIHTPVADETALAAIAAGERSDKMLCFVEGTGLFWFDATGATTAAAGDVVAPAAGTGRWYRITGLTDLKLHLFVADETALAAIPASSRADGMLVLVDANGIYRFDAASAATAAAGNVVAPGAGTGRWFRVTQLTDVAWHPPVADETALAAIAAGARADMMLCFVDANGIYRFDSSSAAGAVTGEIVVPAAGTGRWLRMTDLTNSVERAYRDTATWDLYVGGVNAAAANPGTAERPVVTVAQALVIAKAIQNTTPTQAVRINIAADVAAEAIVVEDTDFTRLSFVAPECRVAMTSFTSSQDNENLVRLTGENIVFSGDFNCTCDVSGATSLFCSDFSEFKNVVIGGNTTLATLGTMDMRNVQGVGTLTVRNVEAVRLHDFSVFGGAFLHDGDDSGDLPAALAAGGTSAVVIYDGCLVRCPTLTESGAGAVVPSVTMAAGAGASGGSVTVGALCEYSVLEGSQTISGGADAVAATGILSLLGGQITNLHLWTINAAATVNTRAWPGHGFHVDATRGNDLFNGSPDYPFATIQEAIDAANTAALTEVDIFVQAQEASYAEALDFDSTTLTRICLHAVGGVVTTTTHECDANSVLDRLDFVGNWVFSGASSLDIAVAADPFLATGFYARDTVWSTSLAITGVTIADLKGSYAAQFSNFECGLVNCPSVGTVWRNEWDQQGDHPLGVTGAAVTLEEGGSGVPPVITHVDTGAAAGSVQVTLRGGVIVGTGAAGRDCVMTAQVANGAILTVEEGARIVGSTDNAGNDNNVGALCVVELLPGGSISNLEGWTVGGTVNDRRSFVSTEQTGTGAPQNVAHGLGRIPEKVLVAFTELPAPAVFQSTEQTGTGAEQNVAHGLGSAPSFVSWGLSEFDGAAGDLVPGAHDGTNLKFTASSAAVKFYCQAILFPAAPDVAEGAHDATNVVLTVTAGAKFKVYAS